MIQRELFSKHLEIWDLEFQRDWSRETKSPMPNGVTELTRVGVGAKSCGLSLEMSHI